MKIVVRMPNWIGDAVLSLPVLDALAGNFPAAEIWVAAREWVKDIFVPNGREARLIVLPEAATLGGLRSSAARLKAGHFDAGLLLTNSFASALVFYLAGIPERWGYARDGRRLLLTRPVLPPPADRPVHQTDVYLHLLSGLGLDVPGREVRFPLTGEERDRARLSLIEAGRRVDRPLIILNPGASYGPAKRWPAPRFAETAALFESRLDADILVVGSAEELPLAETVASGPARRPIIFTGRTSLRELAALLSQGSLFITNDTGPMHIASALGVPIVAVFGPTEPEKTGPRHPPFAIVKKDVPCWPCLYRACPFDHRCLQGIGAEEVFARGLELLR